jgi:hypothetical protein
MPKFCLRYSLKGKSSTDPEKKTFFGNIGVNTSLASKIVIAWILLFTMKLGYDNNIHNQHCPKQYYILVLSSFTSQNQFSQKAREEDEFAP